MSPSSERERRQGRHRRVPAGIATAVAAAAAISGCSTASSTDGSSAAAVTAIPTPLSTSLTTAKGTWVAVPMGHLNQPLNTFWQLFYRADGSSSWTNEVEATAVATNGGLVLASAEDGSLVVGVRPSERLTFSPLIATPNSGRSWSNGVLNEGLAPHPDALATISSGQSLALVSGRGGTAVLESAGNLSTWRTLTTESVLSAGPGRACDLTAVDAVAFMGGRALVGASCARSGTVGMFSERPNGWQPIGPALPSAIAHGSVQVLALHAVSGGILALLAVSSGGRARLVTAWTGDVGQSWSVSGTLLLASPERVTSFGLATGGGMFVLLSRPSGAESLDVLATPTSGWRQLPPPPTGTATVAVGPKATTQALAVDEGVLTVWSLAAGSGRWAKGQVINVPIPYGSSS